MSLQSLNNVTASIAQPQPTDYSLPGVMRYLQNEWHRNERDRIQWDLERAEMKVSLLVVVVVVVVMEVANEVDTDC